MKAKSLFALSFYLCFLGLGLSLIKVSTALIELKNIAEAYRLLAQNDIHLIRVVQAFLDYGQRPLLLGYALLQSLPLSSYILIMAYLYLLFALKAKFKWTILVLILSIVIIYLVFLLGLYAAFVGENVAAGITLLHNIAWIIRFVLIGLLLLALIMIVLGLLEENIWQEAS